MADHVDLSTIRALTVPERLTLVEQIWDSIAAQPESVEVTDAQRLELDRRLEAHNSRPNEAVSWTDVKTRLEHGS